MSSTDLFRAGLVNTVKRQTVGRFNGLARAAVAAPLSRSAYVRFWAVWGKEMRRSALVHPDRKFLYVSVPKAANTTVRRLLWRHLGVEVSGPSVQRTLHITTGPYASLSDLAVDERRRVLAGPETYRFSFVRNPYSRLRSAYLQKLWHPNLDETSGHYLQALGWSRSPPPTFAEFVRTVVDQSDAQMNVHWMPQHRCLVMDAVPYDFIGRVESFEADLGQVMSQLGIDKSLYRSDIDTNRQTASGDEDATYTQELASMVFRRYRRDFEAFGYDPTSFAARS